jgi:hypothetical protein
MSEKKRLRESDSTKRLEEALNVIVKAKTRADLRETWNRFQILYFDIV